MNFTCYRSLAVAARLVHRAAVTYWFRDSAFATCSCPSITIQLSKNKITWLGITAKHQKAPLNNLRAQRWSLISGRCTLLDTLQSTQRSSIAQKILRCDWLRKTRSLRDSLQASTAAPAHANCVLRIVPPNMMPCLGRRIRRKRLTGFLGPGDGRFIHESNSGPCSAQTLIYPLFYVIRSSKYGKSGRLCTTGFPCVALYEARSAAIRSAAPTGSPKRAITSKLESAKSLASVTMSIFRRPDRRGSSLWNTRRSCRAHDPDIQMAGTYPSTTSASPIRAGSGAVVG